MCGGGQVRIVFPSRVRSVRGSERLEPYIRRRCQTMPSTTIGCQAVPCQVASRPTRTSSATIKWATRRSDSISSTMIYSAVSKPSLTRYAMYERRSSRTSFIGQTPAFACRNCISEPEASARDLYFPSLTLRARKYLYFNCFHKNVYASAVMNADCFAFAAPPWPPSMFS